MSSRCEEVFDLLSCLVDGEASPLEEQQARDHMSSCDRCRERFSHLGLLAHDIQEMAELDFGADFATRTARKTIEQARRPSLWRRAWDAPRRLAAAAAAWPGWMRPALGTASLVAVLAGAAATTAGTLYHATLTPDAYPWHGACTRPSSVAEARYWDALLPHLPSVDPGVLSKSPPFSSPVLLTLAIPLLLSIAALLCGLFLLRTRTAIGFLRHPSPASDRAALLSPAARGALGLLVVSALTATPLLWFYVVDRNLAPHLLAIHDALRLAGTSLLLWGCTLVVLCAAGLLARAVRGIPASAVVFAGCWAVGIALEAGARHLLELWIDWMEPSSTWIPATASAVDSLFELLTIVLSPSELVRETVLAAAVLGLLAGAILGVILAWDGPNRVGGSPAGPAGRGLRRAAVGAFFVAGLWLWHLHGFLDTRHLFDRPLASMLPSQDGPDVSRTGIVLLPASRPADTGAPRPVTVVPYPIPARLLATMAMPDFALRLEGPFGFSSPGVYRIALIRATLDWDIERGDDLFARYSRQVPGIHQSITRVADRLKTSIAWRYPPGSEPVYERGETWMGGTERFARQREVCEQAGIPLDTHGSPPPTGTIRGRILVDGKGVAGLRVRLMLAPPISIRADQENEIRDRLVHDTVNTLGKEVRVVKFLLWERCYVTDIVIPPDLWAVPADDHGDFHFENVPPGRHALAVLLPRAAREVRARGHADLVLVRGGVTDVGTIDLLTGAEGPVGR